MRNRHLIGVCMLAAALGLPVGATAQDMSKYPSNWEGQWARLSRVGIWDTSKPPGLGQQAPLTPEYQAILEANQKKQSEGKDFDPKANCLPPGMPRMMMIYQPMEIIIKPNVTYFLVESTSPIRRVYTDGRDWPKTFLPAFAGYSIGQWLDTDGDGRYDTLDDRDARDQRPAHGGQQRHPAPRRRLRPSSRNGSRSTRAIRTSCATRSPRSTAHSPARGR